MNPKKKKRVKQVCKFEISCGNVFADLNIPNADLIFAKLELARAIELIINYKLNKKNNYKNAK